jgi:metal-responsive CopG/Arc/MetJ family transcriptional regulator
MMKRITITLDEDMYLRLLDYSLERSKAELRNFSTSEAVRELLEMQMRRMGKAGRRRAKAFPHKVGQPEPLSS